jgi:hypothetical protein
MDSLTNDVQALIDNFRRTGEPAPLQQAAEKFAAMLGEGTRDKAFLTLRTMIDFELGHWADARGSLENLAILDPDNAGTFRDLGTVNAKLRDFQRVVDSLTTFFKLAPDTMDDTAYTALATALHAVGRGDEGRMILDAAVRRNPNLELDSGGNFLELQQAAQARGLPPLLLNTLFKSASMYIAARLETGLNLPRSYITHSALSGDQIIPSWLERFANGGVICQEHLPARADVLEALNQAGIQRMVVHIRDSRQAMISGIHHLVGLFSNDSFESSVVTKALPPAFDQWAFSDQVDHYLGQPFLEQVQWIVDWQRAASGGVFSGQIMMTSYEAFRADNRAYFEALLAFHDIPFKMFDWSQIEAAPEKGMLHYRSGETNEWERVLSPSQISRANEVMATTGLDPDSFKS